MKNFLKVITFGVIAIALVAVIIVFLPDSTFLRSGAESAPPTATADPAPVALKHTPRVTEIERTVTEREKSRVTIAVGGDVLPTGNIGAKIRDGKFDEILDAVSAERMRDADVTLINLETSVSTRGTAIPGKTYTFRSEPENLAFLTEYLGTDVVSLANNHTPDYGWDAFEDTLNYAHEYGLNTIGAGMNLAEACAPYIVNAGGLRIAFFAANQVVSYTDWPAKENKPGQLTHYDGADLGALDDAMREIRDEVDYIVVYLHWGIERDNLPSSRQINTAKALKNAGADIIIGAHPHVIQSFEYLDGVPVAYSVGNFLFNGRNPETCILYIHIDGGEITFEIAPCTISGTLTSLQTGETASRTLEKWSGWCRNSYIDENGILRKTN